MKKVDSVFIFVFLVFFFTSLNFKNYNLANAKHLHGYMYNHLKNVINENDPTTYKDLKFITKQNKVTWDKRYGNDAYEATFFIFKAKFHDSHDIQIFVNSEFKTHEKIAEVALKFSKMIGQIPLFLRKKVKWIIVHGPWKDKSKCTCKWYAYRDNGIFLHTEMVRKNEQEETLIHESAHVSIDSYFYGSKNQSIWINAQKKDNASISKYAEKNPNREDVAESIVAWVASRCKKARISKSAYKEINNTIPNRLKVLDDLIYINQTYPLSCINLLEKNRLD